MPVNFLIPIQERRSTRAARSIRGMPACCVSTDSFRVRKSDRRRPRGPPSIDAAVGLYAANSIFIGDYLTTPGQAARADYQMIPRRRLCARAPDGSALDAARLDELLAAEPGLFRPVICYRRGSARRFVRPRRPNIRESTASRICSIVTVPSCSTSADPMRTSAVNSLDPRERGEAARTRCWQVIPLMRTCVSIAKSIPVIPE